MADKMVMGALYSCCDCGDFGKQPIHFHAATRDGVGCCQLVPRVITRQSGALLFFFFALAHDFDPTQPWACWRTRILIWKPSLIS